MASHRTNDRSRPLRSRVLEGISGLSVTLQNSRVEGIHNPNNHREKAPLASYPQWIMGHSPYREKTSINLERRPRGSKTTFVHRLCTHHT